jgi:transcriptional regulator GlxA family with amidase domain
MKTLSIGFLGFDGLVALDLVGPLEAFSSAFRMGADGRQLRCYNTIVIGLTNRPFTSSSGVVFRPDRMITEVFSLDTLFIPGGPGLRQRPEAARRISEWIARNAKRFRRVASVCTGIYGLAPTGLIDNRRVATHWGFTHDVAKKFPKLKVDPDAIFIKDGPFYTSAGVTSGIDLALALIEEDFGPANALAVARELVVYLKRPGGQAQYSEPLKFQNDSKDGLADLAAWISTHLRADLSIEALAERAFLCPRHFSRKFKRVFGRSAGEFVETLRLDAARGQLLSTTASVEAVSDSVGFGSGDSFRRAFERRFGIPPSQYRKRFNPKRTFCK